MGFGKTTALREYLRDRQWETIWLSLVGSGGSLAYCWERFTALVGRTDPAMAEQLEQLGFPQDTPQLAKIVGLICARMYSKPTVVVVDDYQLIDCRLVADLITLVAGERVPGLHIVLLARDTRALPVSDLEQKGLCRLLGQDVLRFRDGEIRDYFAMMDFSASEETLHRVGQWTGGWISGIYLVLRGLRQGQDVGSGEDINQLLELNLFRAYDESTQAFLLRLSALDAFTPEQAAYVFEDPAAAARLLDLIQGNAFLSYNSSIGAYKMTDLLREFLQEKARQQGLDPRPVCRRAGLWFLAQDRTILAYDYLYRAGETERILQDLDREDARDNGFAQFPQIAGIFEGLPDHMAFRYPLATLRFLRIKALSGPPDIRKGLAVGLEALEQYFLAVDLPDERRGRILGEIHNTWVFVAFNDAEEIVAHAAKAVEYFSGRYSCIVKRENEFTYGSPHLLYSYFKTPGRLRETAEYLSTHFHILAQAVEGCGAGCEPLALAEYALETGDFDSVELHARKAVYQSRLYGQCSIEICATFVLARLHLYRGRIAEGEQLIAELAQLAGIRSNSVLNTTVILCSAYLKSCCGMVDGIPAWLRENDMKTGAFLFQGVAFPYIVCLRAVLLSGAFIRLEVLCQEFREKFTLYQNILGFIHCDICRAIAREHLYGLASGCEALEEALALAAGDDLLMPFTENALGITAMLQKLRGSHRVPAVFLARVTATCETYSRNVSRLLPDAVSLTGRERDILRMLAQGLKHTEIAAGLFISVPTVRYHVKNAYLKLEVNNKISAIQKARSLDLL